MQYTKLGNTGMDVSRICLGTMGFGDPSWQHSWVSDEQTAREVIKKALDNGINFIDTANFYSLGMSEEIVGRAVRDFGLRDEIVLATKVFRPMREGVNSGGLSRKAILYQVDQSLRRLQTDYIDLYIIHRWDNHTPIEETMETLNDLVHMGKVRYIGASAMYAWQFQKAMHVAEMHGWQKFVSMQDHYNLLYREEEREMIPYCIDQGVSLTPYKSLAGGRLTRDRNTQTRRSQEDVNAVRKYYGKTEEEDGVIIDRVGEVAERNGLSRLDVAVAWILHKQPVAAALCGATKASHIDGLVHAVDVTLSPEDMAYLEEAYVPHALNDFNNG